MSRFFFLAVLFISTASRSASAQYPDPSLMNSKEYARYCIHNLKNGALLVRLNFKSKAIALLEQAGNKDAADQLRSQQRDENLEIMTVFKEYFTFCPVHFFSMDSTQSMMKGKLSGYFLNDDLKVDPSISLKNNLFLIAEEGILETTLPADKTQPDQENVRRGLMADALVIRDKNLELLKDPFPYYIHWGEWDDRVKKLEKRLEKFYLQNK